MPRELSFLRPAEKQEIMEMLRYYGIENLKGYLLTESGKEKVRAYSGSLTPEKIRELNEAVGIDIVGLYLLHKYPSNIRLSFDAIHAIKSQITKNVLELTQEQADEFMKGRDILLSKEEFEALKQKNEKTGFKVLKCGDDFIGTGKLTEEGRIVNYMPKERRLR